MSDDRQDGPAEFLLPAVLDLTAADALKQNLLGVLTGGGAITIDAGAVQRITSPAFQIFAAAAKTRSEGDLRFINVPEIFRETAATLGLSKLLGITET
jgi:anti-anti-sigma regulatory factor